MTTRAIIAAVSQERVIGLDGKIPWHYPADFKRFKRLTTGASIIMGRLTYESIGRPLPNRRNIVITSREAIEGVECFDSISSALATCENEDVWFCGGAGIYEAALAVADLIDLTTVPDSITSPNAVKFPDFDETQWTLEPRMPNVADPRLTIQRYRR